VLGEVLDQLGAPSRAGSVARPEEIAAVIAFLASDAAVKIPPHAGIGRREGLAAPG
jgi:NAD(P)-dependent dehydrogenase (short-subunit alcohol dehydrogenase family)